MLSIWKYSLLISLYCISEFTCLVTIGSATGSTPETEISINRHNIQHQNEKLNGKPLSVHTTISTSSGDTSAASLEALHLASTQSFAVTGENALHHKSSYNLLSEAMSQAVSNEFSKFLIN